MIKTATANARQLAKLLRLVRKASGYEHFYKWEPATDYDKTNSNYPFKPQTGFEDVGGPSGDEVNKRADHWDGGLGDWQDACKKARVGHVIDFYITKTGGELETNVEVWLDSEGHAYWRDCGRKVREVVL